MRYIILLLLLLTASLFAAEFKVISCEEVGNDLTARIYSVKDLNDDKCGVIKVQTDLTGLSFESTIPPTEIKKSAGEYIVYLSPNTKRITIKKEGFMPLQFELPSRIKSEETMILKLTGTKDLTGDIPVTILSKPQAKVIIDGVDLGETKTAKLSGGKHTIRLEKAGYGTIEKEIEVTTSKALFEYTLTEEEEVPVVINSTPSGAKVEIDGIELGVTPLSSFYKSGKYKITLTKDGCDAVTDNITIAAPKTSKSYTLKEAVGYLTINTHASATVYLNGSRITEFKNIKLKPQRATVKVTMRKAADMEKSVIIKRDDNISLDLFPEIAVGKIQVAVMPDDASVELKDDGGEVFTSVGSKAFSGLVVGEYKLTVKANGYKTVSETVNLRDGDKLTKSVTLEKGADGGGDFVLVQGGTFKRENNNITLSDFYIGKYEVTQKEWKAVMGSNPSNFKGDDLPVEQVSWDDCQDFIKKLNAKTGKKYRLPTEAEWEYAARGGNKSNGYEYSGSNDLGSVGWFTDNSGSKTHPVGQKQANELGIYDMTGNVWEWCSDWYGSYSSGSQTNPQGASSGSDRVYRGGSWLFNASYCRVAFRGSRTPGYRNSNLGLRLVLSP